MTFIIVEQRNYNIQNRNNDDFKSYPTDFFTTIRRFLFWVGLKKWKKGESNLIVKCFYNIWKLLLFMTAVIFFLFELMAFQSALGDTQTMVSQIGMMFTHVVGMGKLSMLVFKREAILDIENQLQDRRFYYKPLGDFQPGLKMRREKYISVFIATFIFILYSFVGISAHISTFLMVRKNTIGENFVGNVTCESLLPYYYYYPFDMESKTGCYISLMFMDISLDIFAWYIATLDMLFVALLHLLKTQLNILCEALTSIRQRCLVRLGMPQNYVILHDYNNAKLEYEMYKELTHCTKHLMSLLDVRNQIENIFTFITLAQTLASLLIFASCLYVAARVPVTSPNFFSQLEYFSAVLCQFSVYCWFGNQITLASEAISMAMYTSDWFSCSLRFKKSMILTMTRIQRPLYLSIGKFTPLALSTLLGVVKSSFSYFTVFQSVGDAELYE